MRYEDDSIEKGLPREKIRIAGVEDVIPSGSSSTSSNSKPKKKPARLTEGTSSKKTKTVTKGRKTSSNKKSPPLSSSPKKTSSVKSGKLGISTLKSGIGEIAGVIGDTIRVNYTGMIQETGKYFLKETDYWIELGNAKQASSHPRGLVDGIIGMEFNETREIIVPPELAYGDQGKKKTGKMRIGINSGTTLVYKVRLYGHAKAGTTKMKIVTNVDTTGYEW